MKQAFTRAPRSKLRYSGLGDGSEAWGLWYEGRGGRDAQPIHIDLSSGGAAAASCQLPHLIVGPQSPDLWLQR